jgi:hypothetical protein
MLCISGRLPVQRQGGERRVAKRAREKRADLMRSIKAIGVGVLAVLAVIAAAGVGTANAEDTNVTKCRFKEPLCQQKNVIAPPAGGALVLLAQSTTEPVIKTGFSTVKCGTSKLTGVTKKEMGDPLVGEITGLVFSSCTGCKEVAAVGLGYESHVDMESEEPGADFALTFKLTLKLTGCSLGLTCKYNTKEILYLTVNTETGEPQLLANEQLLLREPGQSELCSETASLSASYKSTVDLQNEHGENIGEHKFWWSLLP